ncbi:Uncharacterised protein [uncultured archaeon]|nr:Uncharacterised protein [uncultured archaeon]
MDGNGARLFVLKVFDGLLTLIGEILVFFGAYAFLASGSLSLVGGGLFLLLLGQLAGVNAVQYENRRKLEFFYLEVLENIGRQFAYPVLISIIYLLERSTLLLTLAFALTLIAVVKSVVIFYKARLIEGIKA